MKNKDKTLNLKASQAIASLGIECESEKWWMKYKNEKEFITRYPELFSDSLKITKTINLQELFSALPDIALKIVGIGMKTEQKLLSHCLLDTYLTNYDMEDVSREIIKIIKE